MPMMKMVAIVTVMNAATTGPGIARITASALGRNASAMTTAPKATPMRRELIPVSSTIDVPIGRNPSGIVPARPDSRLPAPSAATAPCTARKSIARGGRQDTRWMAREPLIVWIVQTTPMNRNAGSSPQKAGPKSRARPGHSIPGKPIQEASATRPVS